MTGITMTNHVFGAKCFKISPTSELVFGGKLVLDSAVDGKIDFVV